MLIENIARLEKEAQSLQQLEKSIEYYSAIQFQMIDLSKLKQSIIMLITAIKELKTSEAYQDEFNDRYMGGSDTDFLQHFGKKAK